MVLKAKKVVRSKTKAKKKTVSKPPVKKKLVIRKSAKVVKKKAASKKTSRALKPEIRAVPEFVEHLKHISEETKYYTGSYHASKSMPAELSFGYGDDKIVICVRDPLWVYSYWELTLLTLDNLKKKYGNDFYNARKVLRVYDVTGVNFDGKNYNRFFDIDIAYEAGNWYINTAAPGRSWCVDLGFIMPNGEFVMILRSNIIHTPLDGPSWITDEEWMIPEEMFARLYGMGFGFGKSSPGRAWQEKFKKAFFSGILSSPGMASMASPTKKLPKERKFWLVVNTELIVYGATEPDAKVTVQGKEIKLRPDGTFSLRFALPDGKQTIPVKATSSDKEEERVITPIVLKETK